MRLRQTGLAVILSVFTAGMAIADPISDQVTEALIHQGFAIVSVDRTWLGRLRIVAQSDELRREIVINPHTGEVLRDYSVVVVAAGTGLGFEDDNPGNGDDVAAARIGAVATDPAVSALESASDSVAPPVDAHD